MMRAMCVAGAALALLVAVPATANAADEAAPTTTIVTAQSAVEVDATEVRTTAVEVDATEVRTTTQALETEPVDDDDDGNVGLWGLLGLLGLGGLAGLARRKQGPSSGASPTDLDRSGNVQTTRVQGDTTPRGSTTRP